MDIKNCDRCNNKEDIVNICRFCYIEIADGKTKEKDETN